MTLAAGAMAFAANFPDIALLLALAGLFISLHFVPGQVMHRVKLSRSRWALVGVLFAVTFFVLLAISAWPGRQAGTPRGPALTIVAVFCLSIAAFILRGWRRR
jgi:hypothetical protein